MRKMFFAVMIVTTLLATLLMGSTQSTSRSNYALTVIVTGTAVSVVAGLAGVLVFPAKAFCEVDCGDGLTCPDSHPNCCARRGGKTIRCCPSDLQHYCESTPKECYRYLADAQKVCGSKVIVCGRGR